MCSTLLQYTFQYQTQALLAIQSSPYIHQAHSAQPQIYTRTLPIVCQSKITTHMANLLRQSVLRTTALAELPAVLQSHKGTPIEDPAPYLPQGFQLIKQSAEQSHNCVRREFQFKDFKEAFKYFNLIVSTLSPLNYRPTIFNVYNRVVIDFNTQEGNKSSVTTRDIFMTHLVDQTLRNPLEALENAHKNFSSL